MGYFRADERYLNGASKMTVDAPWKVEAREAGAPGQVILTWRRPYAPVDSYGIYGRLDADPAPGAWRELLRMPGTAAEATIQLALGPWHLAVNARRAAADSPLVPVQSGALSYSALPAPPDQTILPLVAAPNPTIQVAAPVPPPPQPTADRVMTPPPPPIPEHNAPDTQYATRNTQHATRNTQHSALGTQHSVLGTPSYGWCGCCVPAHPLIRQGDALICPARPERHYGAAVPFGDGRNDRGRAPRQREPPPGLVPEPVPELDWTAIDAALRANSAQLGRHGLFVRPAPDDYDDRYR